MQETADGRSSAWWVATLRDHVRDAEPEASTSAGLALYALALCTAILPAASAADAATQKVRASVFVAPGGSDARSCRSPRAACATFNRAFRVARPGDTVEVAGGAYSGQSVLTVPGRGGPNIVFRPAAGARVTLDGLTLGSSTASDQGPRHVTFRGMRMSYKGSAPGARNQEGIFVGPGSKHIRLERMDAGSVDMWFADRIMVLGGDYGPCDAIAGASNVCGNSKLDASTNVTVDGALFHDYRFDSSCFADGADCHWECMYINGGENITIRNSKFRDCAIFDIFATISGAGREPTRSSQPADREQLVRHAVDGGAHGGRPGLVRRRSRWRGVRAPRRATAMSRSVSTRSSGTPGSTSTEMGHARGTTCRSSATC